MRIFLLSLVRPQPVALQRLNTGMRMNSRIEGSPMIRISPVWPLLVKNVIFVEITRLHLGAVAARPAAGAAARACASAAPAQCRRTGSGGNAGHAAGVAVLPSRPRRPIRRFIILFGHVSSPFCAAIGRGRVLAVCRDGLVAAVRATGGNCRRRRDATRFSRFSRRWIITGHLWSW